MTDKIAQQPQISQQIEPPACKKIHNPDNIELIDKQLLLAPLKLTFLMFLHLLLIKLDVTFRFVEGHDAETDCCHVDVFGFGGWGCVAVEVGFA